MLWTMGCPPAKVNTQTTHSCPSPKHAYTLSNIHTLLIHLCPYFLFLTCLQGFFFVRIFGDGSLVSLFFFFFFFFLTGDNLFSCFDFPDHIPTFTPPSILCSYIPAPNILTAHTQDLEDTSFSLNLNPFRSSHVVVSTSRT